MNTCYFYLFSGAPNWRSLQATYMKFVEYVDMLVEIVFAKFKNDRAKDSGNTGCTKMENNIFSRRFQQFVFYCCVTVQDPNCHHLMSGILAISY